MTTLRFAASFMIALLILAVLGCESSEPRARSTDDAGAGDDAAEDGGAPVPDLDAARSDSGPDDAEAGAGRDAEPAPDPCSGDVVLEANEDVAAIADCTQIFGTLTLAGPGLTKVDLPLLEHLGGGLSVMGSGLDELELPALVFVGKDLSVIDNERLTQIELPSLTQIVAVEITGNRVLSSLVLPALERSARVQMSANPALIELELPTISFVDSVLIEDNDALEAVRMPSLVEQDTRDGLRVTGKALASIDLSALRSAIGLSIASDAERFDVQLPELEYAGELWIGPSTATSIALPKLASVYSTLSVSDNPLLASLELPVLSEVGDDWSVVLDEESGWGLFVENDEQLTNVDLPALQMVAATLSVQSDPMLSSLTLTSLRRVEGNLLLRDSALTTFSAPVLASIGTPDNYHANQPPSWYGELIIEDNPLLESFELPLLTSVGDTVQINHNATLQTCDAQALSAQLTDHPEVPPVVIIEGNAGTCP